MKHFHSFLYFLLPLFAVHAQEPLYPTSTIDSSLSANSNAVVRLHRLVVTVDDINEMSIASERVITVFNKMGQEAVNPYVGYNDSREIKDLEAIVYNARGKEVRRFKERDFKDRSRVHNGTLYSDSRLKYLQYRPSTFPYTIKFSYVVETENTLPIPGFSFVGNYDVAVEKSEYILNFNENEFKVRIAEKNFRDHAIQKTQVPGSISFSATNLAPIQWEAMGPSLSEYAPRIMVSPSHFSVSGYEGKVSDWKTFGYWMFHDLLAGRAELPEATVQKMKELTKNCDTPLEKAKIIYDYVQKSTRYISVQVGIGGFQPATAMEVDQLKYGDCKGLTNYARALLKSVHVPSYYTHVESGGRKVDFETDFASMKQGDHVILAVPYQDKLYWADCTSSTNPFGFLGSFTDDRQVLMITPQGGKLVRTPNYSSKINFQNTVGEITVNDQGDISCDVRIATGGTQYDHHINIADLSSDKLKKHYRNYWDNIRNLKITDHQFKEEKEIPRFVETIHFQAPSFATKAGKYLLMGINPLNQNEYVPPSYKNRRMPFHISRGYVDRDSIRIQLPKGYKIESVPDPVKLNSEFGSYRASLDQKKDGSLLYINYLSINSGKFPKEKYEAYRNFRKAIANYEGAKITLVKTEP